ncbi:MAG: hypothetical protein AAF802_06440 [Planctomycetota bacterium]
MIRSAEPFLSVGSLNSGGFPVKSVSGDLLLNCGHATHCLNRLVITGAPDSTSRPGNMLARRLHRRIDEKPPPADFTFAVHGFVASQVAPKRHPVVDFSKHRLAGRTAAV